jgi:hypothetical protein
MISEQNAALLWMQNAFPSGIQLMICVDDENAGGDDNCDEPSNK